MGEKLLITEETSTRKKKYSEIFDEYCPFFINIGMPLSEYWDGDCSLTRYYRKAYELKRDNDDYNAWLNGAYVYEALSVSLYNMFGRGKGKQAIEYAKEPYRVKLNRENKKAEAEAQAESWMRSFVSAFGGKNDDH